MSVIVDTRFAGGATVVDAVQHPLREADKLVELAVPGSTTLLQPDEARRLAVALIEQAAAAERPAPHDWLEG